MASSSKNILLIVEGEVDETGFIDVAKTICFNDTIVMYFVYGTSIYELYEELRDDEYIDIKNLLKVKAKGDPDKVCTLSNKFSDIYLIFDLDPHYHKYSPDSIMEMLQYFKDSMNQGRLYINYPMMQSYKHFSKFPSAKYKDLDVYVCDCSRYKDTVDKESCIKDLKRYNFELISQIVKHNVFKCNYILSQRYETVDYNDYRNFDFSKILALQLLKIKNSEKLYVLNTSVFMIIDYLNRDSMFKSIMKF